MDRMRIAVDARPLEERPTGVGRYLEGLLTAWLDDDERTTPSSSCPRGRCSCPRPRGDGRPSRRRRPSRARSGSRPSRARPRAARGRTPSSAASASSRSPAGRPSVATVHDLTPLLFPEWHSSRNRLGFTPLIRAQRAQGAGGSLPSREHSRRDLVARFPEASGEDVRRPQRRRRPRRAPPGGPAPNEGPAVRPLARHARAAQEPPAPRRGHGVDLGPPAGLPRARPRGRRGVGPSRPGRAAALLAARRAHPARRLPRG